MVTSIDINTFAATVPAILVLGNLQPSPGLWNVPTDGVTHSFQYPSGVLFPPGFTFDKSQVALIRINTATLRGYLTPI
jgi:hypothetical protein